MSLIISLQSEFLKRKRSAAWYLTIIGGAILPVMLLVDGCLGTVEASTLKDPWGVFYSTAFSALNLLLLPMFIVLVCTLLPQLEYRNNTWKQLFASPQSMMNIFLAKFMNVQVLILLFLLSFNVCMGLVAVLIDLLSPTLNFLSYPFDWQQLFTLNAKSYIAVLAISAFQFWMGLRFKNFIVPIAIGFVMWVLGVTMVFEMHLDIAKFFPFSFPVLTMFPRFEVTTATVRTGAVVYTLVLLLLAFLDFQRRKIKA